MGTYKVKNNLGECPICGEDMEHLEDERHERNVNESYTCKECRVIVTYSWILPTPSRQELFDDPETPPKELDWAEQKEREARGRGEMTFERLYP